MSITWKWVIIVNLKFDVESNTVKKLAQWAIALPDTIDFIDYWYNLSLSETKSKIESSIANNINAFHWTRWKEDFEEFVDGYKLQPGEGFSEQEREWFAMYSQYLVYELQLSSREIALYYGKGMFVELMRGWFKYHTFGTNLFMDHFTERFGLPPRVEKPYMIVNN